MKNKVILAITIVLFVADRVLKIWTFKHFASQNSDEGFFIIPKIFKFTFFGNHQLAFSLPAPQNLIIISSIIIISMLSLYLFRCLKSGKNGLALAISVIVLGAFSNFYDRLKFGFVIDYLHLWPISYFNLADVMIGGGVVLIILIAKNQESRIKKS